MQNERDINGFRYITSAEFAKLLQEKPRRLHNLLKLKSCGGSYIPRSTIKVKYIREGKITTAILLSENYFFIGTTSKAPRDEDIPERAEIIALLRAARSKPIRQFWRDATRYKELAESAAQTIERQEHRLMEQNIELQKMRQLPEGNELFPIPFFNSGALAGLFSLVIPRPKKDPNR